MKARTTQINPRRASSPQAAIYYTMMEEMLSRRRVECVVMLSRLDHVCIHSGLIVGFGKVICWVHPVHAYFSLEKVDTQPHKDECLSSSSIGGEVCPQVFCTTDSVSSATRM